MTDWADPESDPVEDMRKFVTEHKHKFTHPKAEDGKGRDVTRWVCECGKRYVQIGKGVWQGQEIEDE